MVGGTEGGGFRSGDLGGGRVGYGGVGCLLSRLVPAGVGGRQKDTPCALTAEAQVKRKRTGVITTEEPKGLGAM